MWLGKRFDSLPILHFQHSPRSRFAMSKPKNPIKLFIFFAFAAPAFFTASVPAQSSEAAAQKEVAGTQVARIVAPEPTPSDVKPTSTPSMSQPADLQSDIAAVKAE